MSKIKKKGLLSTQLREIQLKLKYLTRRGPDIT
jgi:hypothetical protein